MKRPISIWIAQLIIGGMALFYGYILVRGLSGPQGGPVMRYLFGMFFLFGLVALWASAFWGLARKRAWGRWLGLCSLISIWGLLLYSQLFPADGPYQRYEYNNAAQRAGASSAQIAIHALFLLLILLVAFSRKVTRYFQNQMNEQAGPA